MANQAAEQNNKASATKKSTTITVKANKKGRHIIGLINFLRVLVIPFYYVLRPFKYYGKRKVADGACVYICNHYGLLDPVYVAATTWEGIHFVGKKEIEQMFLIRGIARKAKAILVNRDGTDVRSILDCMKCLKNNEKMCCKIKNLCYNHFINIEKRL